MANEVGQWYELEIGDDVARACVSISDKGDLRRDLDRR